MGRGYSCDCTEPVCTGCARSGAPCNGYGIVPRFRLETGVGPNPSRKNEKRRELALKEKSSTVDGTINLVSQYLSNFIKAFQFQSLLPWRPNAVFDELELQFAHVNIINAGLVTFNGEAPAPNDDDPLQNSLLAFSLAIYGRRLQSHSFEIRATKYYLAVLQALRHQTGTTTIRGQCADVERQSQVYLLTSLMAAFYEIVANGSLKAFEEHIGGTTFIIEQLGVTAFHELMSRHVLYTFRSLEVLRCLARRKATFLCAAEWNPPQWSDEYQYADTSSQALVSIALDIPPLLEQFDQIPETACIQWQEALQDILGASHAILLRISGWRKGSGYTGNAEFSNSSSMTELYYSVTMIVLLDLRRSVLVKLSTTNKFQPSGDETDMYAQVTRYHCMGMLQYPNTLTCIVTAYASEIVNNCTRDQRKYFLSNNDSRLEIT
ncbi:hypothetical protein F5884DRAFT_885470 [Xylogone sp. PMI_703]|nr:hypothetical protein F5884DRAFT_885470 [Xylogone sp. PMI_703]